MRIVRITRGGQISIPADVRRRWATSRLVIEDAGDRIVLTPAPDDPVAAFRGALKQPGAEGSAELRRRARSDEQRSTQRRA